MEREEKESKGRKEGRVGFYANVPARERAVVGIVLVVAPGSRAPTHTYYVLHLPEEDGKSCLQPGDAGPGRTQAEEILGEKVSTAMEIRKLTSGKEVIWSKERVLDTWATSTPFGPEI